MKKYTQNEWIDKVMGEVKKIKAGEVDKKRLEDITRLTESIKHLPFWEAIAKERINETLYDVADTLLSAGYIHLDEINRRVE